MIGSIQPGPLGEYLRRAMDAGIGADGLMQRFQLAVWPDVATEWRNVDRWPNKQARQIAFDTFDRLDQLDPSTVRAQDDPCDADGIPFLRFGADAQQMFDSWRSSLKHQLRRGDDHPAIVSHMAKYRSLIPSLALLIHLADACVGPVTYEALAKAIRWGKYLETHARRIYAPVLTGDVVAARSLAQKLSTGQVDDGFALRDVYRKCWTHLANREDATAAAEVLCDFGWLIARREATAGRTRTRYWINPKTKTRFANSTDKTDRTDKGPQSDPLLSVLSVDSHEEPSNSTPDRAAPSANLATPAEGGAKSQSAGGCNERRSHNMGVADRREEDPGGQSNGVSPMTSCGNITDAISSSV